MAFASAPGKVLICGGYLVVEAPNIGLSIGVSARFTTRVVAAEALDAAPGTQTAVALTVLSPQFGATFCFDCTLDGDSVRVDQREGPTSPFLLLAALYSLANNAEGVAARGARQALTLELLAANDFYSQRNWLEQQVPPRRVTAEALRGVPPHNPLVGGVSKTGLGSSAAMTTSVVACLHKHFAVAGAAVDVEAVHRVAQAAHSVAQGKIGSGFDVFTATYGTCIYRRFPAERAECMMTATAIGAEQRDAATTVAALRACVDLGGAPWVEPIAFAGLPRGLELMLGDVHQGGSSTPGMVAKVMAWRKRVAGAPGNLWDRLAAANGAYVALLQRLVAQAAAAPAAHDAAVAALATRANIAAAGASDSASEEERVWCEAAAAAATCRQLLREAGAAAEVEIEPPALTPLLDATAAVPGVFAVGCPGAGGYDAVFALVLRGPARAAVEALWEGYASLSVCPLLVTEDARGVDV